MSNKTNKSTQSPYAYPVRSRTNPQAPSSKYVPKESQPQKYTTLSSQNLLAVPRNSSEIYHNFYYDKIYGPYKFIKFSEQYNTIDQNNKNMQYVNSSSDSSIVNIPIHIDSYHGINTYAINPYPKYSSDFIPRTSRLVVIVPLASMQVILAERNTYLKLLKTLRPLNHNATRSFTNRFDEFKDIKCDGDIAANISVCPIKDFETELPKLIEKRKKELGVPNVSFNMTLEECSDGSCVRNLLRQLSGVPELHNHGIVLVEDPPIRNLPNYDLSIPGGKRDPSETPYYCAKREFREETGINFLLDTPVINPESLFARHNILYGQGIRYMGMNNPYSMNKLITVDYYFHIIPDIWYDVTTNPDKLSYVEITEKLNSN
jgi:hypothetical protein